MQISSIKIAIRTFFTPRSKKRRCVRCSKWFIPYAQELRDSSKGSIGDYFCIKCFMREMEESMKYNPLRGLFDKANTGKEWDVKWIGVERYKK